MADASHKMERLESLLEVTLRGELLAVYKRRDAAYTKSSECVQLRRLLQEMQQLTPADTPTGYAPRSILVDLGQHVYCQCALKPLELCEPALDTASPAPSATDVMVQSDAPEDCHRWLHINVGCGVVVPMSSVEATRFLLRKEAAYKERAAMLSKEVLRVKYRIRIVTEAIRRLALQAAPK